MVCLLSSGKQNDWCTTNRHCLLLQTMRLHLHGKPVLPQQLSDHNLAVFSPLSFPYSSAANRNLPANNQSICAAKVIKLLNMNQIFRHFC